ncbi:hypothetical protein JYG23_06670 [Sedimentibacter sp. zth1]|uniref:hypothetical protein n=1 Tax=Sedimentibacter sp. zth1 TaxID=2816908 RepID=UPI001A90F9B4|nr:hypothetical protein [Sedimentibacter sp. zth1]QSX07063.1 hypothetical protein JYG23_06670 [Sedimentibacter sp. zth1]
MNYVVLFLADGVLGYFLQSLGYVLSLYAFNRRKADVKTMLLAAIILAVIMFGIRQISVISFGYHTVLIIISDILLSVVLLKTSTFYTVLSALTTTMSILILELINLKVLNFIIGHDIIMLILNSNGNISSRIYKSLLGAPTNVVLVLVMFVFYKLNIKRKKGMLNGVVE